MDAHLKNIWSPLDGDRPDATDLKSAIERRWPCSASLIQTVPVRARLDGNRTWDVVVHVFDLAASSKADRAYAWSSRSEGTPPGNVFTALHVGPINSPANAVGAAVSDELRVRRLAKRQQSHG